MRRRDAALTGLLAFMIAGCAGRADPPSGTPGGPGGPGGTHPGTPAILGRLVVGLAPGQLDAKPAQVAYSRSGGTVVVAAVRSVWMVPASTLPPPAAAPVPVRTRLAPVIESDLQVVLAPDGEWQGSLVRSSGLPKLELFRTGPDGSPRPAGEPRIPVHQGRVWIAPNGRFVLTGVNLPPPEGTGRYQWTFWSTSGRRRGEFPSDRPLGVFFDPDGERVAFRDLQDLTIRDGSGDPGGSPLRGRFADVALSRGARTVAAAEAADRSRLRLRSPNWDATLQLPGPAQKLAVSPSGRLVLAALDDGRIVVTDLSSMGSTRTICLPEPGKAFVTSAFIRDDGLLTAAVALTPPSEGAVSGWILQARDGTVLWHAPFETLETTAFIPQVTEAGDKGLLAWNFEKIELLDPPDNASDGTAGCTNP